MISRAVDFDELYFITVFGLEFIDYLVPFRHKLDAVATFGHEKVNDDECVIIEVLDDLLEQGGIIYVRPLCFPPPVEVVHYFERLCFKL